MVIFMLFLDNMQHNNGLGIICCRMIGQGYGFQDKVFTLASGSNAA